MPEPELKISHADHLKVVKDDCARCHTSLPEPAPAAAAYTAPRMATCLGCHNHQDDYDAGKCEQCHKDLSRYALRPLTASFSHEAGWLRGHKRVARSEAETCAKCHEQTFCADCHAKTVAAPIELEYPERVDREFIHRGDYLTKHTLDARSEPETCARCHGTSFCQSCHVAQNLTPDAPNPRSPHPPGWAFPTSADFHGPAARRDINSCAACHDQGARSNCVGCHKVGGVGGNPHPPGWTDRHGPAEINTNSMCRTCH
jgi:hypothetical protein